MEQIPNIDRDTGDLRNIIGVVPQTNDEGLHRTSTKHCIGTIEIILQIGT